MTASEYLDNHTFAVFFTIVAAASQGLGGALAVVSTASEYGPSVAHLMSFSTGVMVYLSFMDIMMDTTSSIGDWWSSVAFFAGAIIFLLLEVLLPEVEGTQFAEVFGFVAWAPSPQNTPRPSHNFDGEVALAPAPEQHARVHTSPLQGKASPKSTMAPPVSKASLHQRLRNVVPEDEDDGSTPTKGRALRSPKGKRGKADRSRDIATAAPSARQRSPPPSEKRKLFEQEGESSMTTRRQNAVAFSGMMAMISISLHNIPEGIAVYLTCLKGVKSGLPLGIAMSLHNIPEGMAVAGPLYAATKSKSKAVLFATLSGAFEIVGCALVQVFFDRITPFFMDVMLSLVAGIMVSLALIELLPSCLEVLSPKMMGCSCISGMVFMWLSKNFAHAIVGYE